jgi:hypothetical protein
LDLTADRRSTYFEDLKMAFLRGYPTEVKVSLSKQLICTAAVIQAIPFNIPHRIILLS